MRSMAERIRNQQCQGLQYKDGRLTRCRFRRLHEGVCDFTPLSVAPVRHTTGKPCLACRRLVKGDEQHAADLRCATCKHFHTDACPEVLNLAHCWLCDAEVIPEDGKCPDCDETIRNPEDGPTERQIEAMYDRPSQAEQLQTQFTIQDRLK